MGSRALLMLIVLFHSAICAAKTYKCSDNYYGDEPINTDCEEINIDGNGLETTNASKILNNTNQDLVLICPKCRNLSLSPFSTSIHRIRDIIHRKIQLYLSPKILLYFIQRDSKLSHNLSIIQSFI